jgi:hypothetical protein
MPHLQSGCGEACGASSQPRPKVSDRLDQVRGAHALLTGSRFGVGAGAGRLRGALTGSTTMVRERPGSVMA